MSYTGMTTKESVFLTVLHMSHADYSILQLFHRCQYNYYIMFISGTYESFFYYLESRIPLKLYFDTLSHRQGI